jgi:hypothetical protein
MKILFRGLAAAACATAVLAQPALAADVTIRAESASGTLVPTARVSLPGPAVDKTAQGGTTCDRASGGSALEAATGGDWGGRSDSFGQRVERIRNETHLLGGEYAGRYWRVYLNGRPSDLGLCGITPQQGDDIVLFPVCAGATTACFDDGVLNLDAPATVRPGEPFAVGVHQSVTTFDQNFNASTASGPSDGATVSAAGRSATTNGDGRAQLSLDQRGPVQIVATKGNLVREAVTVCVTDGADGACGSTVPGTAAAALAPDRIAPRASFSGLREGRVFARGAGPRVLRGKVDEGGGVFAVKLKLTRTDGARCSTWSKSRERFVRRPCGAAKGWWFSIGDRADWEYQLAERLPRGRYVLDVNAIDKAYNRDDQRRRGGNRVVFRVR